MFGKKHKFVYSSSFLFRVGALVSTIYLIFRNMDALPEVYKYSEALRTASIKRHFMHSIYYSRINRKNRIGVNARVRFFLFELVGRLLL